jgi:hypothetical protein
VEYKLPNTGGRGLGHIMKAYFVEITEGGEGGIKDSLSFTTQSL